jgi:hypothetical protein
MSKLPVPYQGGKKIVQTGNEAGGHIAGGNIYAPDGDQTNVEISGSVIIQPPRAETHLNRLYRKLREEAEGDQELTEYIDQLQIFTRTVEDEAIVGLDGKFEAAGRQDELNMAKAMKEMIYSELRKNMFSRTFQTIYATLMGKVYEEFQTWVRPAIAKGASREAIDALVNSHVVKPVVAELETCPEYNEAATPTVRGMIYFLTGNCHLVWR